MQPELIVWDFDGVLNANLRGGRPFWADDMQVDLGIDPEVFVRDLFHSGAFRDTLCGRLDLLEFVSGWLARHQFPVSGQEMLTYWFERDAHPDEDVLSWAAAHPARQVIGTNNEPHRCRYIEASVPVSGTFDALFSSGRLGVAKPDPAFFAHIENWAGTSPSRILLVDDTAENIDAAVARGWDGFHFSDETRALLPDRLGL